MLIRIGLLVCGVLAVGLVGSRASAQSVNDERESFKCRESAKEAIPRLIENLKSKDEKVRNRAINTLGWIGKDAKSAAPALVEIAVNSRGHALALRALAKIDDESTQKALRQLLVGGRGRCKCGNTFVEVVAAAGEPIVPHLIALLPDQNVGRNAEIALASIGEPAVPALFRILEVQSDLRPAAVRMLIQMGPKGKAATPVLEKQLGAAGPLKLQIALALNMVNGTHPAGFETLHAALKGDDKALRLESLQCFAAMGTKAKVLVPDLMKLLTGDDDAYRYPAIHVLTSIGAGAVPTLVDTLKEGKANRLDLVAQTLAQIGPAASPAIPEFIKILKGNDAARATWAAQSFPSFGPDSKQAIPDLLAALKSDHFKVRYAAANSLVMIDRNQIPNTIEALTSVLASADANERRQAIWLLASFSDKARPAVPAMLEAMKGETLQARLVIADAVMRIDKGQADTILPTLMEAIQVKKGMPGARQQVNTAVRILTQLGPKAKAAAPALEAMFKKALKDENADIDPYMIANALTRIDASAPILTILIESLNSASAGERNEARYVVEDLIGARALPSLEAAIANGQLRESVEVTGLMKQLRQRTGAVN